MNASSPALKTGRRNLGTLAALVALGAGLWLLSHRPRAADRPASAAAARVPVTVATAQSGDVDITLNTLGTVTPVSMVTVTSRVGGLLTEVHYREGQDVKRGDLLAVIDPRPYQAAVVQAQGQLARDQALLDNARIDVDRYRLAYQKHAIPEQQVATQEATVREDQGIVQIDQGSLDAARVNLDYTHITSPIDGRVGLRLIDAGNIVAANGTSGLLTIAQLRPITVIFTLAQEFLPQVARGMRGGRPLRVEATERGQSGQGAQGELLTIDNQIDQATGTFRLKAVFPNDDDSLWPGEFVDVRLVTRVQPNAVTVPAQAVQSGPNGSYLFIVKPDLTVDLREVQTGQSEHGRTVIAGGLAAGERVVVDGQYRLEPGSRVMVQATAP